MMGFLAAAVSRPRSYYYHHRYYYGGRRMDVARESRFLPPTGFPMLRLLRSLACIVSQHRYINYLAEQNLYPFFYKMKLR